MSDSKPADPAPADGDLVERLCEVYVDAFNAQKTGDDDERRVFGIRAVLCEVALHGYRQLCEAKETIARMEAELAGRALATDADAMRCPSGCPVDLVVATSGRDSGLAHCPRCMRCHSVSAIARAAFSRGYGARRAELQHDIAAVTRERDEAKSLVDVWKNNAIGFSGAVDSLTRELAEARDTIARHEKALAASDAALSSRNPTPTGGGERACVADERVPRVGDGVRLLHETDDWPVERVNDSERTFNLRGRIGCYDYSDIAKVTRRAQPAPQAEAAPLLGPNSREVAELQERVDKLERYVFRNHVGGRP